MTISGFATPDATAAFQQAAEKRDVVAQGHFRTLLSSGLSLSSLGVGTYLGEPTAADDAVMTDAIVTSVTASAVNVLDTAINYRHQLSERAMKTAIQKLQDTGISREALFIASKNGFLTPDAAISEPFPSYFTREFINSGLVNTADIAGGMHCMSPAYLEHQLDRSLENLGLETLDLMYLHNGAESQIPDVGLAVFMERLKAAFTFYEQARQAGKIRYYGLATWNCFRLSPGEVGYLNLSEVVLLAVQIGGVDHGFRFVQMPFNLAMPEALTLNNQPVVIDNQPKMVSFLEAAQHYGLGVFTSVPLLQGQLLNQKMPKFEGLTTPAQACLQFVRSTPGIVAPLVGHKQPAHVRDNLKVASVPPVSFDVLQELLSVRV